MSLHGYLCLYMWISTLVWVIRLTSKNHGYPCRYPWNFGYPCMYMLWILGPGLTALPCKWRVVQSEGQTGGPTPATAWHSMSDKRRCSALSILPATDSDTAPSKCSNIPSVSPNISQVLLRDQTVRWLS